MSILNTTWPFLTASWNRGGVAFAVAACALTFFTDGNFWLTLLSDALIGAAAFCFGAHFQETRTCTCTCPEESEVER